MSKQIIPKAPNQVGANINDNRIALSEKIRDSKIPDDELIRNLPLYILPTDFQKILFFNDLYQKVLNVHGVILEFGCRWGNNLATFQNLRSIYEPFNHNRKIVGFDTFEGFKKINNKDKSDVLNKSVLKKKGLKVSSYWESELEQILLIKEKESPVHEKKKFEIIKGDVSVTLQDYLEKNPHTIISFAYFDMDLYEPTLNALNLIKNHITKGTILGFDELNNEYFPGESIALNESLGFRNVKIERSRFSH